MERNELAERANVLADGAAPVVLRGDSARDAVAAWLAWNDPNGVFTDADSAAEGMRPISLPLAWELIADVVEQGGA